MIKRYLIYFLIGIVAPTSIAHWQWWAWVIALNFAVVMNNSSFED